MKVLSYPHSMEVGGSQLNGIQLAGAIRDRGHEVIVISEPGPLVAQVNAMGLEHIEIPLRRARPSLAVARTLAHAVEHRAVDVVHGYEWPPIIEAYFGVGLRHRAVVVGTVMSMSVVHFLPRKISLTVGTARIREAARNTGHEYVTLLEPPVDMTADHPSVGGDSFRRQHDIDEREVLVAMICRLAPDLKLEGLLSACEAVGALALAGERVRLMIIGDGPARARILDRAAKINASAKRPTIILAGPMTDPRPGYAAADILIGQGGSALRSMAFAKPLIVIGEDGFSEMVTPESAATFLQQGWYGLGAGTRGTGVLALQSALKSLIASERLRAELGSFGRKLVEDRFSLTRAAQTMEEVYRTALHRHISTGQRLTDAAESAAKLIRYKAQRKARRWLGMTNTEDGNERARIASVLAAHREG